jgi:hypothetical protein
MGITKEIISGTKIINEIKSSNIKKSEYDLNTKKLLITFNNDIIYEYDDVPHKIYTQFRLAESQGKFFSTSIAKTYKYVKK